MRKILCLSTSNYYPFPTRKQNIMNRMTDAQVIYIDPAITYIAPLKDRAAKPNLKRYKYGFKQAMPHIKVYAQPPVLPFYNKKRAVNRINQKNFARYIKGIIKENNWDNDFWIWCYNPNCCDLVPALAKEIGVPEKELWNKTIYDCVDRHSAYPGMINPQVVDSMEEELAKNAAFVFTTADGLYERLKQFNSNCSMIPNGCNYELFSKTSALKKENTKTVFGFVGVVQECTDQDCLKALAKAYPDSELRIIGKRLPGVDVSELEEMDNIRFLGLKPQEKLPEYIKDFDVCLNVFADNALSKDVSPLKFYEYLATGKPVVSTPQPLQVMQYEDCIYIAHSTEEFVKKCGEALCEKADDEKRCERLKRAALCSWDERVKSIKEKLSW